MKKLIVSDFNHRFVELADSLAESDSELAKRLGVSRQTISAWRNGSRSPHTPAIETVARKLGVSVAWLSGCDVPMYDETREDLRDRDRLEALHQNPRLGMLFDRQREMSESDIDMIYGLVDRILKERDGE